MASEAQERSFFQVFHDHAIRTVGSRRGYERKALTDLSV